MGEEEMMSYLVNVIIRIMPNADLNNILDMAVDTLIEDYMRYSTLLWGLCPSGNYPACRDKYLLDEGLENILSQADWYYNAQLNSDRNILAAISDGVEVFDIVDYNEPLYQLVDSWDDVNADGIIQLDSTSMGAFSYGVDIPLPDDYVPTHSNCTDPTNHNHADPNGIVDACTGLLPETTFYFYNQNHEQTASNDVIMKLVTELLTDSNFTSVFSYPDRFPQFNVGRNSKSLMRDLEEMRNYDTSNLTAEEAALLQNAIAEADAALAQTNVNIDEFEEAKANFYEIRDQILNRDNTETENKDNGAFLDFGDALKQIMQALSDILYLFFNGAGFSEM